MAVVYHRSCALDQQIEILIRHRRGQIPIDRKRVVFGQLLRGYHIVKRRILSLQHIHKSPEILPGLLHRQTVRNDDGPGRHESSLQTERCHRVSRSRILIAHRHLDVRSADGRFPISHIAQRIPLADLLSVPYDHVSIESAYIHFSAVRQFYSHCHRHIIVRHVIVSALDHTGYLLVPCLVLVCPERHHALLLPPDTDTGMVKHPVCRSQHRSPVRSRDIQVCKIEPAVQILLRLEQDAVPGFLPGHRPDELRLFLIS